MLRPTALAGLLALALWAGGCGGDGGSIPASEADALLEDLSRVEALVEQGDCGGARDAALEVESRASELGAPVDPQVRRAIRQGSARLVALTVEDCAPGQQPAETEPPATGQPPAEQPAPEQPPAEQPAPGSGGQQAPPGQNGTPPGQQDGGGQPAPDESSPDQDDGGDG